MKYAVSLLLLVLPVLPAAAADRCDATDDGIKACVRQYLIDTNVVVGNRISDPGGGKTKAATESCQYDCATKPADFDKKWRQPK